MAMKSRDYRATIEGVSDLLQHRFTDKDEGDLDEDMRPVVDPTRKLTRREKAEQAAYRLKNRQLYFPGAAIVRMCAEAGASHKQKGNRKSIKYVVPAAMICLDDSIPLHREDGSPIVDFEVDSRSVVIPATKGRVMRHRPRIEGKWRATFNVRIYEDVLGEATIRQLLVEGGQRVGIGDYRPQKMGPFGRFDVVYWEDATKERMAVAEEAAE